MIKNFVEKNLEILLLWVRHSKDSKVPHEPLAEFGDVSGGVWIDRGAVCDTVDIAPRVCVLIVEATIINVFSHQLHSRLLSWQVNLMGEKLWIPMKVMTK